METINIAKSIRIALNASTQDGLIQLTDNNNLFNLSPHQRVISRNKFIKNLKAYASINSLPEAVLPDLLLEDSEFEKLNKVLNVEWGANRKQLNLFIGSGTEDDWMPIGETSLLNPAGYPYRIYNLLDILTDNLAFEMGNDVALAVRVEDVGFGLLADNDKVNIYGSYVEEIVIDDSIQSITSIFEKTVLVNEESVIAVLPNEQRKYVIIQNNNPHEIYFSLSNLSGAGSVVIKPNGHYELFTNNVPYYGDISVYSDYNSIVLIVEGT
ncbi:MAG: hypothetical protein WBA07_33665 [Rivularia sp. (in: cyanobacteria)]